jgi:Cu/Zn superoxide dismutase
VPDGRRRGPQRAARPGDVAAGERYSWGHRAASRQWRDRSTSRFRWSALRPGVHGVHLHMVGSCNAPTSPQPVRISIPRAISTA